MADEVIPPDGLDDGETMFVHERAVVLDSGKTVWLRRYYLRRNGRRRYLANGKWLAQLGDIEYLFAVPQGVAGGSAWRYGTPYSFDTWQEALAGAREAEALVTV